MTARLLILSVVALAVAACTKADRPPRNAHAPSPPTASVAPPFRSDCTADTSARHPNPRALLDEALARNARGEQARGAARDWWAGASECPDNAPGWDTATLVSAWRVDSLSGAHDSLTFVVRFAALGVLSGGTDLQFAPRELADTVLLVRVATGWRLADYGLDLFLYPATARATLPDMSRAAQQLDSIVWGTPSPRPGV